MKAFCFLGLFLITVACFDSGEKKNGNVLNVALSSNVPTLDQAMAYDTVSAQVVYQVHETLYEYDYLTRPYTLKPLLAQEMPTVTNEGKTVTVKIKKGVLYHPHPGIGSSRELNAEDFVTQIKRIAYLPTRSPGWWLFEDKILGLDEFRKKAQSLKDFEKIEVEGLKAVNPRTLQIKLKKPYPQLTYALAMSFTAPAPLELVKKYDNELSSRPVGTGPFVFKEWRKNLSIKLVANKKYRYQEYPKTGDRVAYEKNLLKDAGKRIPFLDGIVFHVIPEARPRMQNFLKKKIDFVTLTKDYFQSALDYGGKLSKEYQKEGIELQTVPTLTYWWLAFNMQDELLGKNLKLRQAIAHAVDNERLIKLFTQNIALKANSIYPPGIAGYDPSSELPYSYNPAKAKALLEEAGYPKGKGLPALSYDIRGSSSVARQTGEFIKSELGKIGIKVNVVVNTFPGFLNKARAGELQFWQGGWSLDYPDAHNVIQLLASQNHPPGPNTSYYSSALVDHVFEAVSTGRLDGSLTEALESVEDKVNSDLPWIMQYYARDYVLYHSRLKNFRPSDLIYNIYKYVRLK